MPIERTALLAQTGRALGAVELFLAAGRARLGEEILLPARWSSALARSHVCHIGLGLDSRECGGLLPLCAHRFAFERLTAGGNGLDMI